MRMERKFHLGVSLLIGSSSRSLLSLCRTYPTSLDRIPPQPIQNFNRGPPQGMNSYGNNYNQAQNNNSIGGFGQGQSAYTGTHSGYSSFPNANISATQYGNYQ